MFFINPDVDVTYENVSKLR